MKKYILRLAVTDEREKRKAMKIVSTLPGIDEIAIDMKGQTLTIIGTVDPVSIVGKLRKFWQTHIISVGPAKEPEKKEEPKKEEPKKDEAKKEEAPKEEPKKEEGKKEEAKKEEPKKEEEKKAAPAPFPAPTPIPPQLLAHLQGQVPVIAPGHVPYIGNPMQYRPYYPPMQTYYYPNHSIEENPNACVIC